MASSVPVNSVFFIVIHLRLCHLSSSGQHSWWCLHRHSYMTQHVHFHSSFLFRFEKVTLISVTFFSFCGLDEQVIFDIIFIISHSFLSQYIHVFLTIFCYCCSTMCTQLTIHHRYNCWKFLPEVRPTDVFSDLKEDYSW